MNFLRRFHNSLSVQKTVINYNTFLSFVLIGLFFAHAAIAFKYYLFYGQAIRIVLILGLGGMFAGNLLGRLLYARYGNFRFLYKITEVSFILLVIFYFLLNILQFANIKLAMICFIFFKFSIPILIFIISLVIGIKINFSIRISCGEFIFEKQSVGIFFNFMLLGVLIGVAMAGLFYSFNLPIACLGAIPLLLIPSIFLVNPRYNSAPLMAGDSEEEIDEEAPPEQTRRSDKMIFTYLNFFYILMYAYLGYVSISKFYGGNLYIKLLFAFILLAALLAGYLAGRLISLPYFFIYGETLFPAAFLVFLILLLRLNISLYFVSGILLFIPVALVMGVVLNNTIRDIMEVPDNKLRSTVIEFATIFLPAPVLISLGFVDFTSFWYYFVLGVIMVLNVFVPSMYIVNSAIAGYKKAIFFFISLIFIPLFIFIVMYFNISLDSSVYATRTGNFDILRDVNYNAGYIKSAATINLDNSPVFNISDSIIRNYKRALVPVSLYNPGNKKIIFIDGNQKFFRNPVIGYFENSVCLDVIPDRDVDFKKLPLSGTQNYAPDSDDPLCYFQEHENKFFIIVDIPNVLDQNNNTFRFSSEYYSIAKKRLEDNGVFVQLFSIPDSGKELFSFAVSNMRKIFKKQIVYFFSNIMVIMSSDDAQAFDLKQENYSALIKFFTAHDELSLIFLNEGHVLSHLLYTKINDMLPLLSGHTLKPALFFTGQAHIEINPQFYTDFTGTNRKALELTGQSFDQRYIVQTANNLFQPDDSILTLLKRTELAEAQENYKDETRFLFELKKQAEYRIVLQEYIFKMLKYKEKYYYNLALQMERNKKWNQAEELYKSVLFINGDNFDANYRMGLLCLTLQNIDGAFTYLQQAMRINKNHPKVLFQMGIIYFSIGKIQNAIDYFNKALQQNEKSSAIYRYLGLCYQNLGNLTEAEKFFSQALLGDPNDMDTKSRLDEVRSLIQKENKKWETPEQKNDSDVEQDAEMPLPVSKGAYDIRLKDENSSLPVIDPQTGKQMGGAEEKKK
jgi:tetratricopeptide (TPR) repeat protein